METKLNTKTIFDPFSSLDRDKVVKREAKRNEKKKSEGVTLTRIPLAHAPKASELKFILSTILLSSHLKRKRSGKR